MHNGSTSQSSPGSSTVKPRNSFSPGASTSGPIIVAGSRASPTRRLRTASASRALNAGSSYMGASMMAKLAAEHFWPA
ncbi:unannotated protein [freshwater metagenome]|uniref:Unannotated protein n=1 Tax=freshwater metagenome TaxID=449393 RepID=A0A6J6T4X9_9ZZZZ